MADGFLSALAGDVDIITDPDIVSAYCRGWRGETGRARFVARPRSTQDVSKLVSESVKHGFKIIPQSGRTGLVGGSVPNQDEDQIVLSLEGLTSTFETSRTNRSLTCSAGFRLSEINQKLEADGLFFPIDLGADPCIGGMIATNTGGSRLLRYGDVRQNVMGLTVVLGDEHGTVLKLGRDWRKHAIGPDWMQMFIGSGAAFGIVTECVLDLQLRPKQQAAALLSLQDESALPDAIVQLEDRFGSLLSACEFMSDNALKAAYAHTRHLKKPFGHDHTPALVLLVEISCDWPLTEEDRSLQDVLIEGLAGMCSENENLFGEIVFGRAEEIWAIRHAISEGVRALGRLYAFDLSFARQDVLRFREAMTLTLDSAFPEIKVCDFGHVGDGGIHFNLIDQISDDDWTTERERSVRDLVVRTAAEDFNGCFSAEHGVGPVNFRYFETYVPAEERRLSAALEAATSGQRLGRVHFG